MSKPYVKIPIPTSYEAWKENRISGIGGSDCAAALGMSPWKSPYYLWCEKTRRISNNEDNEAMRIGRDLEEYVAKRFCEETGKKVQRSNFSYQSKEYPFMLANVDRLVVGEDAGLECKTTSALTRTKYDKGDIPIQYYMQCMHYMAVTGKKKWYIAVLVMGKGFYWYEVERDEDEIKIIIEREQEFWNYVLSDSEPPIDGSDSTCDALMKLYPDGQDNVIIDLEIDDTTFERYDEVKSLIKKLENEKNEIENQIKEQMGVSSYAYSSSKKIQWKNIKVNRVDTNMLKNKYQDIYIECLKETNQRRFSITDK